MNKYTSDIYNYTIPKIKRELKRGLSYSDIARDYTIPKIKRELKPHLWSPICRIELYHTKN